MAFQSYNKRTKMWAKFENGKIVAQKKGKWAGVPTKKGRSKRKNARTTKRNKGTSGKIGITTFFWP